MGSIFDKEEWQKKEEELQKQSQKIWDLLFDQLKPNGLEMKKGDPGFPFPPIDFFIARTFIRRREGQKPSFFERHFGMSEKSKNFEMVADIVALPKIMKYKFLHQMGISDQMLKEFPETENEIVVKMRKHEATSTDRHRDRVVGLLFKFRMAVLAKLNIVLQSRVKS